MLAVPIGINEILKFWGYHFSNLYGSKNIFVQLRNKHRLQIQKLSNDGYEKNKKEIDQLFVNITKIQTQSQN